MLSAVTELRCSDLKRNRCTTVASAFLLAFFVNVLTSDVAPWVEAESCWDGWVVSSATQRSSAAAVRIGAYAFILGGTTNAAYDNCRQQYFNGEVIASGRRRQILSSDSCTADYVLDVVPVRMVEAYYESPLGSLNKGIHGRQFAASLQQMLLVCYACSWSLFDQPSTALVAIQILPRGTFQQIQRTPMPTLRCGATMVTLGVDMVYIFGGTLDTDPDPRVLAHNITEANGGSWTRIIETSESGPFPTDLCDCSGSSSHDTIFLMNCMNCTTQTTLNYVYKFYPGNSSWGPPKRLPFMFQDQVGASNAVSLAQFSISLWPNGVTSPHAFMYDMVLDTTWDYPVEQAPSRLQHAALLAVGTNVYSFGGNPPPTSRSTPADDAKALALKVDLLPHLTLNDNASTLVLGDELMLFANDNCLSDIETLRLATSPECKVDDFVSTVPAQKCNRTILFDTAPLLTLEEGITEPHIWVCVTQGLCGAAGRPGQREICTDSSGNVTTQTDCRWAGCCWTDDGHCYKSVDGSGNRSLNDAYWYASSIEPVWFTNPNGGSVGPEAFYQQSWFKIAAGVVGALVLYAIIICVWRQTNRRNGDRIQSLDTLLNSSDGSFGVFGKKYKVEKKIGQGGFGTVFLASRRSDDVKVAIKYIPCKDAKTRDNAIKEFDMSQTIRHPNKMECLDLVVHWSEEPELSSPGSTPKKNTPTASTSLLTSTLNSDHPSDLSIDSARLNLTPANRFVCLVMPLYEEGDLRRFTLDYRDQHQDNLPGLLIMRLANQLLSVTAYLHALEPPIVHRDIKPENILVCDSGSKIILTDFGMAHYQTQTYMTTRAGTLHYSAPETWKRQYTASVDVWSVGCVIYAMSTGQITKDTTRVMFDMVDDDDFEDQIQKDLAHLPMQFIRLVLKMFIKDPKKRISAASAHEALKRIIGETVANGY